MTVGELRKIVHEEVVKAMREELREILTEGVRNLDYPEEKVPERSLASYIQPETKSISGMLRETAQHMGRNDFRNLTSVPEQQTIPGLPDFISAAAMKAKAVLDASNQKDRERYGI